ncbi:FecR family protein [Pedobacter westerhofensis]|uniref:FecR family protein n=1 Tax=Pedobacter westerhofensis TaxID=425512 RepID=A0A521CBB1_9SPHI|nr:FecR domain-containing protein [Pedobacter westerhofensis]SMO56706.1 FecR family protein [Pedobacter westerhofensis]
MQNKDFDALIEKYLNDELSIDEKSNVESWIRHITDHSAAEQLSAQEQTERGERIFKALGKRIGTPGEAIVRPLHPKRKIVFQRPGLLAKIAASLLICCSLIFCFRTRLFEALNIHQYASVSNSGSDITKTILSDGSIVWLKGDSELTYPLKFKGNLRNVNLEGEALFEIAKDPAHPFEIHCAGLKTRVLGTSFNIKHTSHKIEVNVLTGRVFLSSAKSAPLILHPYQKAVYLEQKKIIVKQAEPVIEVASLTRGTEYMMQFNDARVSDVLHRIENKFEVQITLTDKRIINNRVTADFTDQSLLNTISMMSDVFNLDFRIDGQSVTLEDKS